MSVVFARKQVDATWPDLRDEHREGTRSALADLFDGQRRAVLARVRSGIRPVFDADWEEQIAAVAFDRGKATALEFAERTAAGLLGKQEVGVDPDLMDPWIGEVARVFGENAGTASREDVEGAVMDDGADGAVDAFGTLIGTSAGMHATSLTTSTANFGAHEGARVGGGSMKTWRTNSGNPRAEHAAMSGQTVRLGELFSNGLRWPGDPSGSADQIAGCQCSVSFV